MKKALLILLLALLATATVTVAAGCDRSDPGEETSTVSNETQGITEIRDSDSIRAVFPENGGSLTLANDQVSDFYDNYQKLASAQKYYRSGDIFAPVDAVLEWEADEAATGYKLTLSRYEDLSEAQTYTTSETTVTLSTLFTGTTYYWQIEAEYADKLVTSKVFSFTTAEAPRAILLEGVSNSRDMGGMKVSDTQRIRQGMIYRTGTLDAITDAGVARAGELAIKTELDLRRAGEGSSGNVVSKLGEDVQYIHISGVYYKDGDTGIALKANQDILAREIKVFANPDNYPILMHCTAGRDRTGTLSMLLQGLLGASEEDIMRDFELSFLSVEGCKDDAGTVQTMVSMMDSTINYIKSVGRAEPSPSALKISCSTSV